MPADAPPQPLKYWPAAQKEALHVEQAEAPEAGRASKPNDYISRRATKPNDYISHIYGNLRSEKIPCLTRLGIGASVISETHSRTEHASQTRWNRI